ncbi:MAG: pyruvate kinase [Glaciimonas sp.]|nr:pyruvate kinase [Glaciimonas sp.]
MDTLFTQRTKIVATLGPACDDAATLKLMIEAGVSVVRLNFSHGTAQDHQNRAAMVREIAARLGRPVAILCDLQGPKIRIGKFKNGQVTLTVGAEFALDSQCATGDETQCGIDYKELPQDVSVGDVLLLDDGRIVLDCIAIEGTRIVTTVRHGGILSNNKGINKQGGGLTAPSLQLKDMEDIEVASKMGADYLAVSFPKCAADMQLARQIMQQHNGRAMLIAKIERVEAIAALEEILEASDGIMVARGDLGVEVGDAAVPALQKHMIRVAREMNKLVITATQMMESMITSPIPTRAEVSDVANAVLDGTDAVMLSAESAAGKYPIEAVQAMARTCIEADKSLPVRLDQEFLNRSFTRIDQSIAMAALFSAHHLKVKAIVALTQSGSTALWMSRLNSGVPIYAITPDPATYTRLALYRDVRSLLMPTHAKNRDQLLVDAQALLLKNEVVKHGDLLVLTVGESIDTAGGTNTLKIVCVGEKFNA